MPFSFPFFRQRDAMDCGPACLMMVAAAHGRKYPLPYLRERSYLSREGVSAQGIMEAAETVGFRTMTVKVPFDTGADTACLLTAPLPCVAHWNQNHFVVVHRANRRHVWVADPGAGKFKLSRADFVKSWVSDDGKGVLILLIFSIFSISALLYVGWIRFFLRRRKEIDYLRFQQSGENNNTLAYHVRSLSVALMYF